MNRGHTCTLLALSFGLALPAPASAEEAPTASYREVQYVDEGPTRLPDKRDYRNLAVLSPMLVPPGVVLQFHHLIGERTALVAGGGGALWKFDGDGVSRFKVLGGLDFMPAGNGMTGFTLAPRLSWGQLVASGGDYRDVTSMFDAGLMIGCRWIANPGTTVSIAGGPQYNHWTYEGETTLQAVTPAVEFTFGWAF